MKYAKMKSHHNFVKNNLVTQTDRRGAYDSMECTKCGMKGKRRNFTDVEVSSSYSDKKISFCTVDESKVKKVKLTDPYLAQFGFKKGEIHEVVDCPKEHEEKYKDCVWIYSEERNEPIRLLADEYRVVE